MSNIHQLVGVTSELEALVTPTLDLGASISSRPLESKESISLLDKSTIK